jgi:hypothetical protein
VDYTSCEGGWDYSSPIFDDEKYINKPIKRKSKCPLPPKGESKDCRPSESLKISTFTRFAILSIYRDNTFSWINYNLEIVVME